MPSRLQSHSRIRAQSRMLSSTLILFTLLLLLTACGRSRTPESAPLSTQVPTIEAPTVAPPATEPPPTATTASEEPESTATEEPAAEELATEETGEVEAGEEMTGTDTISETASITATATVTETDTMSDTEGAVGEEIAIDVEPRVFFLQPTANAIIPVTSTVIMGSEGLEVAPAGEPAEGVGHFHIMIDADFVETGDVIPNDESHRHFGDGSTEVLLGLTPGLHTLRLQFADGAHIALDGDQYRDEIFVRVAEDTPEQAVRLVVPANGAVVPPTFQVIMAATGLIVEPSGEIAEDAGHMHILVDEDLVAAGEAIPADETHIHFGAGQLEAELTLEPGEHLLRLQFANGAHIALDGNQYDDSVTVTVEEGAPAEQVLWTSPEDGATVATTVSVEWAAAGLIIEPSGPVLRDNAGHLHILVDEEFVSAGEIIPNDETHLHFGGAQTAAELTLEPGEHVLRLQMANGAHIAMEGDQYRDEISITVEE